MWLTDGSTLVDDETALREVLTPVLVDVEETTGMGLTVELRRNVPQAEDLTCTVFPEGKSWDDFEVEPVARATIRLTRRNAFAEQIASAASSIESLVTKEQWERAGRGGWPPCQLHNHQLRPTASDGVAVWRCPSGGPDVPIGELR